MILVTYTPVLSVKKLGLRGRTLILRSLHVMQPLLRPGTPTIFYVRSMNMIHMEC
jgi:hypothetical protein